MIVKLLPEHHLEILRLKEGYTGSSESTHVKIPHCWKSHVMVHIERNLNSKRIPCADLERFVRGGLTLTFFFFFLIFS